MATAKPPTASEVKRLGQKNAALAPILESGGSVTFVEPDRRPGKPDRAIAGIHDRAGGRSLVALVEGGKVVGVHETPAHFQLSKQEREAAERLAGADERVRSFLRRRRMNALTRLYFPPAGTSGHRYAIVFVRPMAAARRFAVVDLTDEQVVDVLDEAGLTGGSS
jgi:hypothetical protein